MVTTNLMDVHASAGATGPRNDSLEGRIAERVLSRLHEMGRVVHLEGPDHRRRPAG